MIMPNFGLLISPFSKTSKPNRSGTRTRLSLLNCGFPLLTIASDINNLAALLPMSIAANFTYVFFYFKNFRWYNQSFSLPAWILPAQLLLLSFEFYFANIGMFQFANVFFFDLWK